MYCISHLGILPSVIRVQYIVFHFRTNTTFLFLFRNDKLRFPRLTANVTWKSSWNQMTAQNYTDVIQYVVRTLDSYVNLYVSMYAWNYINKLWNNDVTSKPVSKGIIESCMHVLFFQDVKKTPGNGKTQYHVTAWPIRHHYSPHPPFIMNNKSESHLFLSYKEEKLTTNKHRRSERASNNKAMHNREFYLRTVQRSVHI